MLAHGIRTHGEFTPPANRRSRVAPKCIPMPIMHTKITSTHSPPETPRAGSGFEDPAQKQISPIRTAPHPIRTKGQ